MIQFKKLLRNKHIKGISIMFQTSCSVFLNQHFDQHKLSGSLKDTLNAMINACVDISAKVRLGALSDVLGEAGSGNIQGENQKKLDVIHYICL